MGSRMRRVQRLTLFGNSFFLKTFCIPDLVLLSLIKRSSSDLLNSVQYL